MEPRRSKHGIVLACMLIGAIIGPLFRPYINPEHSYKFRAYDNAVDPANYAVGFAVAGAAIGIIIDRYVNGRTNPKGWKINRVMAVAIFVALAALAIGLRCFWEINKWWW